MGKLLESIYLMVCIGSRSFFYAFAFQKAGFDKSRLFNMQGDWWLVIYILEWKLECFEAFFTQNLTEYFEYTGHGIIGIRRKTVRERIDRK